MYEFRFLSKKEYQQLYQTFIAAFADYVLDLSYHTETSFINRTIKNGVELESSVGMYVDGKMVGYTLIGLDNRDGVLTAFDIMTGIIKEYRGKGAAKEMFDFTAQVLKAMGVQQFMLEVVQENTPAVKAYKKTGFLITREFDCYELQFENLKIKSPNRAVKVEKIDRDIISGFTPDLDFQPSWENSFSAIKSIPDEVIVYGAEKGGEYTGILAYYPALNWIMTLMTKREARRMGVATRLLAEFVKEYKARISSVKLINVEHTDVGMKRFLESCGFYVYTTQFEMAMEL